MDRVDVIIVGAGIAGLTAAWELQRSGCSVQVLEARDRVGGRTVSETFESGFVIEMGGQWVGPYQTEILSLIEQLGLETSPTYDTGHNVTVSQGNAVRWNENEGTFSFPEATLYEVGRLLAELESLAEDIPLSRPWEMPNAHSLDHQTVQQWLDSNTEDAVALQFLDSIITGLFYAEPDELSLLHLLFFMKSNGSFGNMFTTGDGLQDSRIVGGSQRISKRLAEEIGADAVRLNAPVQAIRQDENGVSATIGEGDVHADYAIIAIPPILANQLDYSPALTEARARLTMQSTEVSVIKAQLAYPTPFWRDDGLSGFVDHLDRRYITVDSSPADSSIGVLAYFTTSTHDRPVASLPADERHSRMFDMLAEVFGPSVREPVEFIEKVWIDEEFSRGCYGGRFGPGVWTQSGSALTEPFERIHWAGAETSDISNGYMDGAVRSGKRAAQEVLASLRERTTEQPPAVAGGDQ